MLLVSLAAFGVGLALVVRTIYSAIVTFVLPRSASEFIVRAVFLVTRLLLDFYLRWVRSSTVQDHVLALYAPISLFLLPLMWLTLVALGFMLMFWAVGVRPMGEAFWLSGSSITTLGFAPAETLGLRVMAFAEAAVGLLLVALLISYLPAIYSAFARRETAVTLLEVRASNPPSAVAMLARFYRIGMFHNLNEVWEQWEEWFAELEESHTSLAALVFFRSPAPDYSWVTAAGAILDAAALLLSAVDLDNPAVRNLESPRNPQAALCLRAGYLALRRIADYFKIPYDPSPAPNDPISISRSEFDDACAALAAEGVPLRADPEAAWRDFNGWRVNYDTVLLALCSITMAPPAPWSSDRSPAFRMPKFFPRRRVFTNGH